MGQSFVFPANLCISDIGKFLNVRFFSKDFCNIAIWGVYGSCKFIRQRFQLFKAVACRLQGGFELSGMFV